jgi:hypothetical protein
MEAAVQAQRAAREKEAAAAGTLDSPTMERIPGRSVSPAFFSSWGLAVEEGSLFTDDDAKGSEP